MQDAGSSGKYDEEPADHRCEEERYAFRKVTMGTEEGDVGSLTILEDEDDQDEEYQQSYDDGSPVAARSSVGERRLL